MRSVIVGSKSTVLKKVLLAVALSWSYSVTLGLLFAVRASGRFSFSTLWLPGVIPVALIVSTAVSIGVTPIAFWSLRAGAKNLRLYGPILWIVLAAYIIFFIPRFGIYGPYGLLVLSFIGLVFLGKSGDT